MFTLFVTRGNEKGLMFEVPADGTTIGRDLENAVCLTDMEASRSHCEIFQEDGVATLTDLKSSNGTTVNGQMVDSVALRIGDHIQIGQTVLVVLTSSERTGLGDTSTPTPRQRGKLSSTLSPGPVQTETQEDSDRFVAVMKSNLQFMYNASLATSGKEIGPMLDEVLNLIFEWTTADRGCILLREAPMKPLQARAVKHRDPTFKDEKLKVSRSILKHVDDREEGIVYSDLANEDSSQTPKSVIASGISEVICVPIRGRNYGLGLIYIDRLVESPSQETSFGEDHLKLMHVIAHQTAVAIENDEYYATLLEKERMLAVGETAEKLSHRIKNILQSINGGAFLVEEGLSNADVSTAEKGWKIVKRNQERISRLVLEMLLVNNDYVAEKALFCVAEMLDIAVENQRVEAKLVGVSIDFDRAMLPMDVFGDRRALQDAVEYVIAEAIKNSRSVDHASVSIVLAIQGENVEVVVKSAQANIDDVGPETNYKSAIFTAGKEFFPGLELSAGQKILRGHAGNVEIVSDRTQEQYRIWFPLSMPDGSASNTVVLSDN